jgi:hypothetical protein
MTIVKKKAGVVPTIEKANGKARHPRPKKDLSKKK